MRFKKSTVTRRVKVTLAAFIMGAGLTPAVASPTAAQLPQLPNIPATSSTPQLLQIPMPQLPQVQMPEVPSSSDLGINIPGVTPAPPKPPVNNAKPAPRLGPGGHANVFTKSTGRDRRYLIDIPSGYNPNRPAPIVFGFDGWRDSPENFRRYSRLNETGAAREAIRIYPESINHGWEGAPYAVVRGGEDLKFIQQIINEVDRTYNIDRSRIYATGHSNGGGMTAVVACHLPHVFAGVAAVGGAFYDPVNMGCSNRAIPFLIMHGTGDTMMKYHGGYRHGGRHYLAVPTLVGSYMKRNVCAPGPRVTNIPGGKRHVYSCAKEELQLITNPQNHTWNRTPDASQEVWNFLKRQRL